MHSTQMIYIFVNVVRCIFLPYRIYTAIDEHMQTQLLKAFCVSIELYDFISDLVSRCALVQCVGLTTSKHIRQIQILSFRVEDTVLRKFIMRWLYCSFAFFFIRFDHISIAECLIVVENALGLFALVTFDRLERLFFGLKSHFISPSLI